jgi:hypothetical protein
MITEMNPFASATELLAALRAVKVTSIDLTDLYIRRRPPRQDERPADAGRLAVH